MHWIGAPLIIGRVSDLEEQALKKDRRFLVRLVLVLIAGAFAGLWIIGMMTSDRAKGCAAEAVGGEVTAPPRSE